MSSTDATTLINSIREEDVNEQSILDILCRYFAENSSIIWSDVLDEHQLKVRGPDVR
jgi:hypothetical protein